MRKAAALCLCFCMVFGVVPTVADEPGADFVPPDTANLEATVAAVLSSAWQDFEKRRSVADAEDLADAWGELGMVYHAHKLEQPASTCYLHAIKEDSENFLWQYLYAVIAQETGDFDKAAQHFSLALRIRPDYVAAMVRLAWAYTGQHDDVSAASWFNRALSREPGMAVALAGLGSIALRSSEYELAVSLLTRALQSDPRANQLFYPLAQAYRGAGRNPAARDALQKRGDIAPALVDQVMSKVLVRSSSTQYIIERGIAASRTGNYPAAVELIQTALERNPDDVYAWLTLGRTYELSGDEQQALSSFDKALSLDAGNIAANYRTGHLLVRSGRSESAISYLAVAVAGQPQTVQWRLVLANALMRSRRFAEAADHYSEINRLEPGNAVFLYRYGLAQTATGNCISAKNSFEKGFGILGTSGELIQALVRIIATCPSVIDDEIQWAMTHARLLYESRPDNAHLEALAMVAAANRQFDKATELQEQLIEKLPSTGSATAFANANINRYRRRERVAAAWPHDADVFSPPVHRQDDNAL